MSIATSNEADILSRIIAPQRPDLSAEAARALLSLSFDPAAIHRMNELSVKASEGTLTPDEQQELDSYERVGHLLAIVQSKARLSLKSSATESGDI